ncbi:hypothetical protein [Marivita geojedonensis]|uniref:DUF4214 domain-containing protein n=1 Tax=Marivita geojedonensis TaxID=1123756 RepID=A0A1X4NED1_9RHOB|nr:hypothetical protein [Marivita geojedonensis]OSQ45277.1 hypothetical protein MGEO_18330 [Marivita geojedonensis]PRY73902.1 hypothetical protein CLV76_12623 [Marivita geojedonensis]
MALDFSTLTPEEQVTAIFVGYYNRAPAVPGLNAYVADLAAGQSLADVARSFVPQAETLALYPSLGSAQISEADAIQLVTDVFNNLFGRDPSNIGPDNFWVQELLTPGAEVGQVILNIMSGAQGDDLLVLNNKIAVGSAYVEAAIAAGVDGTGDLKDTILDDVDGTQNSVNDALDAIAAAFPVTEPSVPGEERLLTSGTDVLDGTENDDMFNAYIQQNPFAGGVSNSLSSADRLDGKGGYDTLYAELSFELFGVSNLGVTDVQPRVKNIEEILIEARDFGDRDNDQEFPFDGDDEWDEDELAVVVDAKHITDHVKIGSYYSDGDLKIENVTTLTSDGSVRNTDAITVVMDHTDNFNSDDDASDLVVLFDEDYLLSGQDSAGEAVFFLLDQDAELRLKRGQAAEGRLDEIDKNGIRVLVNGSEVDISFADELLDEANPNEVNSHDAFIAALQAPLQDAIAAGLLPAGSTIEKRDYSTVLLDDEGLPLNQAALQDGSFSELIPGIVFTSGDGSEVTALGFTAPDELTGEFNVFGRFDDDFAIEDQPISVNIELEKVGREGEGGDLIVGSKVVDNSDEGMGIEVFHVSVKGEDNKPSNLTQLATTNSYLDAIYVKTHEDFVDADSHASLTIRGGSDGSNDSPDQDNEAFGQSSLNLFDASAFLGDLTLGNDEDIDDLITLIADGGGDVTFFGEVDLEANHSILTGAGNDLIDLNIDGDAVDVIGTSHITNTGAGDDEVIVSTESGVSQETMFLLDNLDINTGSGEDLVEINGYMRFEIDAGDDSDFVILNASSGSNESRDIGDGTGIQDFAPRVLYQAELTVMFAGFEETVRVNTTAGNNYVATQLDINAAIAAAIANNPELARLLTVTELDGLQEIRVQSTVEGENEFGISLYQPGVVASAPGEGQVVLSSTSDWQAVARGLIQTGEVDNSIPVDTADETRGVLNNIAGSLNEDGTVGTEDALGTGQHTYDFIYDGDFGSNASSSSSDTSLNHSEVDMGDGSNDLLVLDSNPLSASTLQITQEFGKVSVVNFFTDVSNPSFVSGSAPATLYDEEGDVGRHALDFTAYLDNMVDPSDNDNAWSTVMSPVELSGDTGGFGIDLAADDASANSVSFLSFDETVTDSISFASLTGSQLIAALNGSAGTTVTGGLVDADLDAIATANLIGTVQDHIVMVENEQNLGEFKVFYLTSTLGSDGNITAGGDFTTGQLLGTIDFGATFTVGDSPSGDFGSSTLFTEANLIGSVKADAETDAWLNL